MSEEEKRKVSAGDVYQTSLATQPVRIINLDKCQVFYEVWRESSNNWSGTSNLKRTVYYYRSLLKHFMDDAKFLRVEPFNDSENIIHRPDLPIQVCRLNQLQWSNESFLTIQSFSAYLLKNRITEEMLTGLNIGKIFLNPLDANGFVKKGMPETAVNGTQFGGLELLWHAHNIQAVNNSNPRKGGIGLHRTGLEKSVPSFYIGNYYDEAGFIEECESKILQNSRHLSFNAAKEKSTIYR